MIAIFVAALVISIGTSFVCSLMEAAYYAVSISYVRSLAEKGSGVGKLLLKFKEGIGEPISAILILNTVAHTAGASVAGWAAADLFGPNALLPFSVIYTLAVLYLSEILPKLIGVMHAKVVVRIFAYPLNFLIKILYPLIWISNLMAQKIPSGKGGEISTEEVLSMAELGEEEGALDSLESSVIENIIGLDQILVGAVMTPRVVVMRFNEALTLEQIKPEMDNLSYSRVPLYSEEDPDELTSYVTQRDIFRELVHGHNQKTLKEISRPLKTVPELMRCDKLLLEMFAEKEHLYSVVDEHGGLAGIITLEDIIEEIIGHEIVDEYDAVSNMRALARLLRFKKWRNSKANAAKRQSKLKDTKEKL